MSAELTHTVSIACSIAALTLIAIRDLDQRQIRNLHLLTLLVLAIATAAGAGSTVAGLLVLRYLGGVMMTLYALGRPRAPQLWRAACLYEPAVFALALAALGRRMTRGAVVWGGKSYGK